MKILLSSWMRELDEESIHQIGIPSIVLMENASAGAAEFFSSEFPFPRFQHAVVISGKGNNGGDGLAIARILHRKGYRVSTYLLGSAKELKSDPAVNYQILRNLSLPCQEISSIEPLQQELARLPKEGTFIVDAIFGTGLQQPLTAGFPVEVIDLIDGSGMKVAAVDIPSGLVENFLFSEGKHIRADVTATFQCLKLPHIQPDGNPCCGKIKVIDIGIPKELIQREAYYIQLIEPDHFKHLFGPRPADSHKGSFGHVLCIAGSLEKPGAGLLAASAVLKCGAGLCTAAVPFENRTLVVQHQPELMTLVYRKPEELLDRLKEFSVVMAGPGLGINDQTHKLISLLLPAGEIPLVLDADGLNVLENNPSILKARRKAPLIITPHPGEFSRLSGLSIGQIVRNRIAAGRDFAMAHQVYLVLKGHYTVLATPAGQVFVNQSGNAGMATAGSGDVLSGLIAGMISQFYPRYPMETILEAAVFCHGYAGDRAAVQTGELSLMASDVLRAVPESILKIDEFQSPFLFG